MKQTKKTKQDGGSTIRLIRKSNDLVEGRYRFDIWETRIFTKMLTMIRPEDEDFKEYRIYLKEVIADFKIRHKHGYTLLKAGAIGLTKKEIRVVRDTEEGAKEFHTHIAVGVDTFVKDGNYVDISFHPKMKPLLLQLKNQYLSYNIENILQLQSGYSVRIYELLKQYEKIGKRRFSIEELKKILVVEDKYPLYANFKQRVLSKAIEDLEENTDIKVEFKEVKSGKEVKEIEFLIFKNEKNQKETKAKGENEEDRVEEAILRMYERLKNYKGVNKPTVERWIKKYEIPYIEARVSLMENLMKMGQEITNPMGFIQSLLSQETFFDPIKEEEENKQKLVEENRKKAEIERQQKLQAEKQKKEFSDNQLAWLEERFTNKPELVEQFFEDFKAARNAQDVSFFIQLAYDNYESRVDGLEIESKDEILYNYKKGGSFSGYLLDWFERSIKE